MRDSVMKIERISALSTIWQQVFERSPCATPFTSHAWFLALADHVFGADETVLLFQYKQKTVGIIPGAVENKTLRLLGDERVTDLSDMICIPGYEEVMLDILADYLVKNDLRVDLYPLEENSVLVNGLTRRMPELIIAKKDPCPVLSLSSTWEEYLSRLNSKWRHELRRKLRKVNGAVLQSVKPQDIGMLFGLMAESDMGKAEFLNEETRNFIADIVHAFSEKGWLRMRAAHAKGKLLGILLAFGFRGRTYLFNMGFDPLLRDLSPGIVTLGLDIRKAIEEKYEVYDFLRGDEDYKYRFGANERYTVRVTR